MTTNENNPEVPPKDTDALAEKVAKEMEKETGIVSPVSVIPMPTEVVEIRTTKDEVTKPPSQPTRIVVVAKTASEMEVAQKQLIGWVEGKMAELTIEASEAEENLKLFTKNKWRTDPSKKAVAKAKKHFEYYEKMKAALEAGYVIIPNMPEQAFDVFAIRTTAKNPRENQATSAWSRNVKDQVTNSPALEEGKYVSPDAVEKSITNTITNQLGKKETQITSWAEEFQAITFPFRLAKPQVLNDTAEALKLGIFDELVASPKFRRSKPHGDPMIMGRIIIREGYRVKATTFLITWFVDSKDL